MPAGIADAHRLSLLPLWDGGYVAVAKVGPLVDRFGKSPCSRCQERPAIGETLQDVLSSILETNAGARYQIAHRAGDQDLVWTSQGDDPGRHVWVSPL